MNRARFSESSTSLDGEAEGSVAYAYRGTQPPRAAVGTGGLLVYRHGGGGNAPSLSVSSYDSDAFEYSGSRRDPQQNQILSAGSGHTSGTTGSKRARESAVSGSEWDSEDDITLEKFLPPPRSLPASLFPDAPRVGRRLMLTDEQLLYRKRRQAYLLLMRSRKRCVGPNTLFVEPRLSIRAILTTVFAQLRLPPLSLHEAATHVQRVAQQPHVMFPLANCVHGICVARGLSVRVLSREEIKDRHRRITSDDLDLRTRVAIIVSKAENTLAAAYIEWPPGCCRLRDRRNPNGALRLLCSAHNGEPAWHQRAIHVRNIARDETVVMLVGLRTGSSARQGSNGDSRPPRFVPQAPVVVVTGTVSRFRLRNAPILPVLHESSEVFEDPFARLPKASPEVIRAFAEAASNHDRSWTRRLKASPATAKYL